MVSFQEIPVFPQLNRIDLFEVGSTYLQLDIPKLEEVFLSKVTHLTSKTYSRLSCFLDDSFETQLCFFNSAEWTYLENGAFFQLDHCDLQAAVLSKHN
jgi:hypothetical protein